MPPNFIQIFGIQPLLVEQLELLDSEQLTKLTNVYRKIKGTDYEGTRVRDAKDAFEETSSPDARKHYSIQSQAHEKRIEETKALIDEVLNEPWLKSL